MARRMLRRTNAALERIPLGTPYPDVVERVRQVTGKGEVKGRCQLVDLLRRAGLGCPILAVTITGGDVETRSKEYYHVPKKDLIVGLQVLLQREALQVAAEMRLGPVFVDEMAAMRVKQTANGHEQFGAWREGEHDDLVFAVALAYWGAKTAHPRAVDGEDGYWVWDGGRDRRD